MFNKANKLEAINLSIAINRLLTEMDQYGPDSPEYPTMLGQLERLYAVRSQHRSSRVDPNTIAIVAGNLFGILIIVTYEQKNVLGSKAISFIMKAR